MNGTSLKNTFAVFKGFSDGVNGGFYSNSDILQKSAQCVRLETLSAIENFGDKLLGLWREDEINISSIFYIGATAYGLI